MRGNLGGRPELPDIPVRAERVRVPLWLLVVGRLVRMTARIPGGLWRHRVGVLAAVVLVVAVRRLGAAGLVTVVASAVPVAVAWRLVHARSARWAGRWVLGRFCLAAVYGWRWRHAMIETGLAIRHPQSWGERVSYATVLPRIRTIRSSRWVDSLRVELLYSQTPEQWAEQAEALRHVFRALRCRVREEPSGFVWLDFQRRDPLRRVVVPAPLDPRHVDLSGLVLGRQEDGRLWRLNLAGTHVLFAGATGAGKSDLIWGTVRALAPAVRAGLVELWVADPKGGMELAFGRGMFTRFATDLPAIAAMLDDAVATMQARASALRGVARQHTPTVGEPLIVVIVDEIASLTAYVTDRDLKRRLAASLPLLLSQGRAPGVVVVGAVQDPRKDVLPFRDLFPTRVALRMTEPEQVDLVLGDGARDRGALADKIPRELPGVGYVLLDSRPEPERVRGAWVTDEEIAYVNARYAAPLSGEVIEPGPGPAGGWTPDVNGGHAA